MSTATRAVIPSRTKWCMTSKVPLAVYLTYAGSRADRQPKLWKLRSHLYRRQFWLSTAYFSAFFEINNICTLRSVACKLLLSPPFPTFPPPSSRGFSNGQPRCRNSPSPRASCSARTSCSSRRFLFWPAAPPEHRWESRGNSHCEK